MYLLFILIKKVYKDICFRLLFLKRIKSGISKSKNLNITNKMNHFISLILKESQNQTTFNVTDEIKQWVDKNINDIRDNCKSLLLIGECRESMMKWARSLGRHAYWKGDRDLSQLDFTQSLTPQYIILDDIEWDFDKVYYFMPYIKCELAWKPCIILTDHNHDPTKKEVNVVEELRKMFEENVVRIDIGDMDLLLKY